MVHRHYDVVCLSHLRWDWVWQRPQHLLSRCARTHRVFYVEEAVADGDRTDPAYVALLDDVAALLAHLRAELDVG